MTETSEPIHVFKPKNDPIYWCLSLQVAPDFRPIIYRHILEAKVRTVARKIQLFVDAAVAVERERACRDACDAVRTWCDENCETVNVPCEKHQQAIAAIREGGES